MGKIIKTVAPYWKTVIVIILLLTIQASCNLALPQYTSNIIDTGIQNRGVEHILPEKISPEEYYYLQIFMTEAEVKSFTSCYKKMSDKYVLSEENNKVLSELDKQLISPITLNATFKETSKLYYEQTINEQSKFIADNSQYSAEQVKEELYDENIVTYTKDITDKNGEIKKTTYLDPREMLLKLKTFYSQANINDNILTGYRKTTDKQVSSMGYDMIKSSAISYAIETNLQNGVDVNKTQTDYLWKTGLKMLLIAIFLTSASISVGFFSSRIGAKIGRDLRSKVFSNVVSFSNKEIDHFSTASLITRSTNDIQQVQMVVTMLLRMALFAPIMSIGSIIKVMNTGAQMAWVTAISVITIAIAVGIMISISMPKFKLTQKLVDNINLISREILTGIPVIRAFKREYHEEKRFDKANIELTKTTLFTNRVMTFMSPVMMFVMYGTSILIVWVSAGHINEGTMQVGEMTAFITYAMHIVMSFLVLTMMSIMLPRAAVAAGRIDEVVTTKSTIADQKDAVELLNPTGVVEFKNVSFRYPGADENVLHNISFSANPGETTAIIGSTGSGKSTLINLIPRFYEASEGEITIDGYNVNSLTLASLRKNIGYVPQRGILFSGTIESNIKYGNKNASDSEMKKAAEIAQATDFIQEKPQKYKNEISQGGTNVSGGQKQRLSIARAIAKNPKIYIFDDSFSALDMKTDSALREALNNYVQNSTTIIVAQRISTIINADKIIVLDEGKVAGIGTHQQLLSNCETYLEIAKSQLSPSELNLNKEVAENE